MAKFTINEGYTNSTFVDAKDYTLANDFFWFVDDQDETVLAYSREKVVSIRRQSA